MESKQRTLRRLQRLYNAARKSVVNDRDRRPRFNLETMSRRYVFVRAQEKRNLTGALVNLSVYSRLMSIGRAVLVTGFVTISIACAVVAYHNAIVAICAAAVLVVGFGVIAHHVRTDIYSIFNWDTLASFMECLDHAASILNPVGTQDELRWLRFSPKDFAASAANAIEATIQKGQIDEAEHQIDLFCSLGLVTGESLKRLKKQVKENATVPV